MLRPSTVISDNAAFIGAVGERAQQISSELVAAQPALASRVQLLPGVEVRSAGDMALSSDWNLMPATGARVGAPMALTLRAAGNLTVSNSLSDGFVAVAGATDRNAITASGVAQTDGASYRLAGGADLSAADPLGIRTDAVGNVTIGRAATRAGSQPPPVFVRTTTGSIKIAAAADVQQLNSQARIYTTGTPIDRAELPEFSRFVFASSQLARGSSTGSVAGPFYENAGDISLHAGRDLHGAPGTTYNSSGNVVATQFVTDWWYRQTGLTNPEQPVALWARHDLFGQGFASFGGGDIRVRAGRDVLDLEVSTPSTGYRIGDRVIDGSVTAPSAQRWFEGGSIDVAAGRDVVSGLFNAGGPHARLIAGAAIVPAADTGIGKSLPVTQILYQQTDWTVRASGALTVSSLTNPGLLTGALQGVETSRRTDLVDGLAPGARAELVNLTGDLTLSSQRPSVAPADTRFGSVGSLILPDDLRVVAIGGTLTADSVLQRPSDSARLELLADGSVQIATLQLTGADAPASPRPQNNADLSALFDPSKGRWNSVVPSSAEPVRMVSGSGDVLFGTGQLAFSARPLRLIAARDVVVNASLQVQHDAAAAGQADDMTLLQAGRDLRFDSIASLRLGGPGDLLLIAGRDVNLVGSPGVTTVGNQDSPRGLASGGANVTVLAGVDLRKADYSQAVAAQFHLIGGGLENFSSELTVQMEALRTGTTLLNGAALSDAVRAFDALPREARRARVRDIVGAEVFERGVEQYVDAAVTRIDALGNASNALQPAGSETRVPGSQFIGKATGPGGVSLSPAEVRGALREVLAEHAFGELLARHVASPSFDDATRQALTLATSPYTPALLGFMQRHGAPADINVAEAAQRFGALAPERQALFLNQVLFEEIRAAGRSATQGERVAYLRGYDALEALFPGTGNAGGINLSSSQVKTQQGGDIRLVAPRGGVNVGELGASGIGRSASDLGIVTVAGGRIETAVRDNLDVNQSRVFTLAPGDLLLWSSVGNLDAGRGAKTVTGSPPPLFTINDKGQLVVDTSGSFSGSGIAVLDAGSSLDLYAPLGEINAGDAGIQSRGVTFLGANRITNADALSLSGPTVGAPPPAATTSANASLGATAQSATGSGARALDEESEEEKRKKRRARRNLLLDFLGFGPERS